MRKVFAGIVTVAIFVGMQGIGLLTSNSEQIIEPDEREPIPAPTN